MGTATLAIAVYLASSGPNTRTDVLSNTVDLIEINHCYDENGQLVFDQLLYYDWCPNQHRYNVRDWRLLKSEIQLPRRNPETGHYVAVWRDGPNLRKVHAKTVRETWTQYDPEIVEQEYLPKDKRRALPKFATRRLRPTTGTAPEPNSSGNLVR